MIQTSLRRKEPSFAQLYDYINRKDDHPVVFANNLTNPFSRKEVIQDYQENYRLLPDRKNGNALYHEILSLKIRPGVSVEQLRKVLIDAVDKYIRLRGNGLLWYGRIHVEDGHIHAHLMASSNELCSTNRYRLSVPQYNSIRRHVELYILDTYPEIQEVPIYTNMERSIERNRNSKEYVKEVLEGVFSVNLTREEFKNALLQQGISLVTRGKTVTAHYEKRRFRLKTLGLLEEYHATINRVREFEKRLEYLRSMESSHNTDVSLELSMDDPP